MPSRPFSDPGRCDTPSVAQGSARRPPPAPSWTIRTRPTRSVTNSRPSGARSIAHGATSPLATSWTFWTTAGPIRGDGFGAPLVAADALVGIGIVVTRVDGVAPTDVGGVHDITARATASRIARRIAPGSRVTRPSDAGRAPLRELGRRHRRRDEVTLRRHESDLDQAIPRDLILDADSRRGDPSFAGRAHHRVDILERPMVAADLPDETPTDLHDVGRQRLEDVRIVFGRIVDRHADVLVAQELERGDRRLWITRERASGGLHDQKVRSAGDLERQLHEPPEVLVVQVLHGQVDRDRERRAVAAPDVRLEQRLAQHPERQAADESGGLGFGNEFRRRHDPAVGMAPADERLDAGEPARKDLDDRLVVEEQLVLGDRTL